MEVMGRDKGSPQKIDGMLDHVLDRRHGRDVSLEAALRAQQIHHILSRVYVGICYVTILIRVGISRLVSLLSFACCLR